MGESTKAPKLTYVRVVHTRFNRDGRPVAAKIEVEADDPDAITELRRHLSGLVIPSEG